MMTSLFYFDCGVVLYRSYILMVMKKHYILRRKSGSSLEVTLGQMGWVAP
jgi:hypothetical protein